MAWPAEDVQADPSLGLALCRLAMGLDELYRRTQAAASATESALAGEGLVPVDLWRGAPLNIADWTAASDWVAALQAHVVDIEDPIRRVFLEDTLRSLATTVAWQSGNDGLTFRDRASRLLGLPIAPIPTETVSAWRRDLLNAIGLSVLDWEHSRGVDPQHLPTLFQTFAAEARERTLEKI